MLVFVFSLKILKLSLRKKKKNLFSLGSRINTTSNDKNRPDEKGFVYYCLKSDLYTNFLKENESIIKEVALRSLSLF